MQGVASFFFLISGRLQYVCRQINEDAPDAIVGRSIDDLLSVARRACWSCCLPSMTSGMLRTLAALVAILAVTGDAQGTDVTVLQITEALIRATPDKPADFSHKDLSFLDLSSLDFRRANLAGANLYGADLCGALLVRADLSRANLTGANLTGADLTGADLDGTILKKVTGLDGAKGLDRALHRDRALLWRR